MISFTTTEATATLDRHMQAQQHIVLPEKCTLQQRHVNTMPKASWAILIAI